MPKKIALQDVMFKGIRKGKNECNLIPLVVEVNAREKYEAYFDSFFSQDRQYQEYTSISTKSLLSKVFKGKKTRKLDVAYEVVVKSILMI